LVQTVNNPVRGKDNNPVKDKPPQIALYKFTKMVNFLLFHVPVNNPVSSPVRGKDNNPVSLAERKN
jgi:hypothetical protein